MAQTSGTKIDTNSNGNSFIEEMLDCDDKLKQDAKLLLIQAHAMLAEVIQKIMYDAHLVHYSSTSTSSIIVANNSSEKSNNRLHWPSQLSSLCASYAATMSLRWDLAVDGHFAHTVTCSDFYRSKPDCNDLETRYTDAVKFVTRFDFPAHLHKDHSRERHIYINEYVAFGYSQLLLPTLPLHQLSEHSHSAIFKLSDKHWKKNIDFDEILSSSTSDVNFNHFFDLDETSSLEIKDPIAPVMVTKWGCSRGFIDADDDEQDDRIAKIKANSEPTIQIEFARIVARGPWMFAWEVKHPLVISI